MKNNNNLLIYLFGLCLLPHVMHAQLSNNNANLVMQSGIYLVADNMSFQNNGNFQTSGTVKFTGSTNASVSGTTAPAFYTLEVNKPGAALQLQTGIAINNQIVFTNGLLNLNGYNIVLASNAYLNGESETSRITGTTGGYVQITYALNAPSAVNPGNLGAVITAAGNLGSTIIRRGHVSQTNGFSMGNSIYRYYDIIPTTNTSLNATLRINYFDAELNGLNENGLVVWKSLNTVTWNPLGADARSTTANFVTKTGIADMARFTLSSPINALPLVWGSFNTKCVTNGVAIHWQTEQENNTRLFVVSRSSDGANWQNIATLPAAGNSHSAITYSYTDASAINNAYYRIVQEDVDGRQTLSPVIKCSCAISDAASVYPNPAYTHTLVSIQTESATRVTLQLYDSKGVLVKQQTGNMSAGINQIDLPLGNLAQGIYTLAINWGNGKVKIVQLEKL